MRQYIYTKGISLLLLLFANISYSQYTITDDLTAKKMVEHLSGEGVIVFDEKLSCNKKANGHFKGTGEIGMEEGIILSTGGAKEIAGPFYSWNNPSVENYEAGDADLTTIIDGVKVQDACYLEFKFTPAGDSISFDYIFSSVEYYQYSCSKYNDVFGFFISGGPEYGAVKKNIAVIPGTNIPVCVNSTTGFKPLDMKNCTSLGTGSPFASYYKDNTLGKYFSIGGLTPTLKAVAKVTPCDTYTLKLAIGDGTDMKLDSDVFIKSGSLTSSYVVYDKDRSVSLEGINKYILRGCAPGEFVMQRSGSTSSDLKIPVNLSGTAINGVDYEFIENFITIKAGETDGKLLIKGKKLSSDPGSKYVIFEIVNPYDCKESSLLVRDTIYILNNFDATINVKDTIICQKEVIDLVITADDKIVVEWMNSEVPVGSRFSKNISVSPAKTTTYKAKLYYPDFPCDTFYLESIIRVDIPYDIKFEGDYSICPDGSVELNPKVSPALTDDVKVIWTPTVGLSDPNIINPIASPSTTTRYVIQLKDNSERCSTYDTVVVTLIPNTVTLDNNDTTVCSGTIFNLKATGHPLMKYKWIPEDLVIEPSSMLTAIKADRSTMVYLSASKSGCKDVSDSFKLNVEMIPEIDLGKDRILCMGDTTHLYLYVKPVEHFDFSDYSIDWEPKFKLTGYDIKDPIFVGNSSESYAVTFSSPIGCKDSDSINIIVNKSDFLNTNFIDTLICPIDSLQLIASGAIKYKWLPADGLTNDTIANPYFNLTSDKTYLLTGMSEFGCRDSVNISIKVASNPIINMKKSHKIYFGEQYPLDITTNAHYFNWYPPEGISNTNIANPVFSPEVNTRYYLTATNEYGCTTKDSIDIIVDQNSIFKLPNAFNPKSNSDFKIIAKGDVTLKKFEIFDRWGQSIFVSYDITKGWDGMIDNKPAPMGVYVYYIEGVLANGQHVLKNGNVTLLR